MCGIVGYVGGRKAVPILLQGLRSLEYRGYDSAGLAYPCNGEMVRYRCAGKLAGLETLLESVPDDRSHIGLGHTRWATHGEPTEDNAHPHCDCSGTIVVVHNGIIENYSSLRRRLESKGHLFTSQTDTEVIAHLIEDHLADDLEDAVCRAVAELDGAYSIGVLWAERPDILVAVRNQSPLVLGVHDSGCRFIASDIPALLPHTREVIFLEDQEMVVLNAGAHRVARLDATLPVERLPTTIDWGAGMAEKAGFRHFMLKEIHEQPLAIRNTTGGRLEPETGRIMLPEIEINQADLLAMRRISLVACGTSWHAALLAKYWLEQWAALPVEVDIASEFRYRELLLDENVLVIAISQSGETADTLAAMRRAKKLGAKVITICNVVGSTMTREADGVLYTHAGPEIGVASTKAFTCQLVALLLLTFYLAQQRAVDLSAAQLRELSAALLGFPQLLEDAMAQLQEETAGIAEEFYKCRDFLYLGRGPQFPIALEGALKLKEISYIHAEGYPAGELKHGPIALIDKEMPVLALLPPGGVYDKVVSNVEEVRARHGRMILVGSCRDPRLREISEFVIPLPEVHEILNPILYTVPLQLLAYQIAVLRGCDVDQPRNLAKSVTVE